jgi:hypothetical protein
MSGIDSAEPRSKKERLAYVEGYARAVLDVRNKSYSFARQWAMEMLNLEKEARKGDQKP